MAAATVLGRKLRALDLPNAAGFDPQGKTTVAAMRSCWKRR
jgi:hypothetical protein